MANQTGRPIAPARKLVAAVLGTIAVFIMVFGLGLSSWPIVALGAALLALSIALGMVNVVRRGARAWVAGSGQVKAISDPPLAGAYGRAELQLTVVAPGLPINDVLVRESRVPVGKWPQLGDTLPISVDVDDMRRVRILWDEAGERADDGDPPPPAYEPADEFIDDDLLGDPEPPPWAARDRSWGRGPDEPPPPPPPGADPDALTSPIVVRDTHGGPVLEGQFVDLDSNPQPLPQRARTARPRDAAADPVPTPRSADPERSEPDRFSTDPAAAAPDPAAPAPDPAAPTPDPAAPTPDPAAEPDQVGATARSAATQGRPSGARPSPRPRPEGSTQIRTDEGTPHHSPEAAPTPAEAPGPVVPGQRAAAPPGATGAAPPPAASPTVTDPQEHDIDLPLDGDPEPAPEFTAHSADAVDHDLIAPPADAPAPAAAPTAPADAAPAPEEPGSSAPSEGPSAGTSTAPQGPGSSAPSEGPGAGTSTAPQGPGSSMPSEGPGAGTSAAPGDGPTITGLDIAPAPTGPEPTTAAQTTPPGAATEQPATGHAFAGATAAERPTTGDDRTAGDRTAGSTAGDRPAEDPSGSAAGDAGSRKSGFATAATIAGAAFTGFALGAAARHHGTEPPPSEGPATDDEDRPARPWADLDGGYEPDDRTDDLITAYPSARPGPAGAIHGVGITVLVTALQRSIAFYRDTLGFFEIDNGPGSAVLASGDTRLVLRSVQSLSADPGRLIYLNLEVGDVDAVYDELRAKGVTFEHAPRPVNRGGRLELWAATFYDPDGHNIAITQWKAIRDR